MAEFDRHADRYDEAIQESIRFSGLERAVLVRAKARRLLDLVHRRLGDPRQLRALDVGCGDGLLDSYLGGLVRLEGVDLSEAMVERAQARNPGACYQVADGTDLPFPDATFDLSFAVCVLHHVPPDQRHRVVAELRRVTRRNGLVVVMEHNPWNPLTRLAVARCSFDRDAALLERREASRRLVQGGLRVVEQRYILFFPWSGPVATRIESLLAPLPLGAQYYVAAQV